MTRVASAYVRHEGTVCLVETDDGRDAPSRPADGSPETVARRVARSVGRDPTLVRRGASVTAGDRTVLPFLFDADGPTETDRSDREWTTPTALAAGGAPGAWAGYRAVAPSVGTVAADTTHGAAWLSVRALEVVRDTAATAGYETVAETARAVRIARPEMPVVATRVDRVMAAADRTAAAVHDRAVEAATDAARADRAAAERVAARLDGPVFTLSRSGTVAAALADTERVFVAESRPGGEGRGVAASLADNRRVTLVPDAAIASVVADHDVTVLVGADRIAPDGRVRNKVGTRTAALAARDAGRDAYVVAARDKIAPVGWTGASDEQSGDDHSADNQSTDSQSADDQSADDQSTDSQSADDQSADDQPSFDAPDGCTAYAPTFEWTPGDWLTLVTEDGPLDAAAVRQSAERHAEYADWDPW